MIFPQSHKKPATSKAGLTILPKPEASPKTFVAILRESEDYNELSSSQKMAVNEVLAELSEHLQNFHAVKSPYKLFNPSFVTQRPKLQQILNGLDVWINAEGHFEKLSEGASAFKLEVGNEGQQEAGAEKSLGKGKQPVDLEDSPQLSQFSSELVKVEGDNDSDRSEVTRPAMIKKLVAKTAKKAAEEKNKSVPFELMHCVINLRRCAAADKASFLNALNLRPA